MAIVDRAPEGGGLYGAYRAALGGVGLTLLAVVTQFVKGQPGLTIALVLLGLITAGASVASGLARWRDGGLPAVGLWVLLALACALGHFAVGPAWDSFAVLLTVGAVASAAAAVLTALPPRGRKVILSIAFVLHFAAIATAVVVIPPRDGQAPWLAQQIWMRLARPYLLFANLNNGYHFYAPDPGPTALLWFRVQYADGASRWVRLPDHDACDNHIERRRWGALATAVSQTAPTRAESFEELFNLRMKREDIPLGPIPAASQYREPTLQAKMLLEDFARYVARHTAHPLGEDSPVVSIKVYRAEFYNPPAEHFHAGRDPYDPTLYLAFYQGEFTPDGKLTPASMTLTYNPRGELTARTQDPLLYWLIPIVRVSDEPARPGARDQARPTDAARAEGRLINYVRIHAGEPGEESVP